MKTSILEELLTKYKVVIPPIQRDYAQGRMTGKIPHIRSKFIKDMANALTNEDDNVMELDFIYGFEEQDHVQGNEIKIFKPLDGQQRLTTLYLLHWYIAYKENEIETAKKMLSNFSYSTRKSSRDFCEKLISFIPEANSELSIDRQVENEPWFFSAWKSDPTICSMLVVLKEIESEFKNKSNVWNKLTGSNPQIIFHLLPMDDLGLPDDLYIKMNARGKELTDFEHFKSRFSEILDEERGQIFIEKIDKEWSELFWNIFKDADNKDVAQIVDNGFSSFFWYITNILIKKNNISIRSEFWLDQIKEVYENTPKHVDYLFYSLDLFAKFEDPNRTGDELYFNDIFYIEHTDFEVTKTRIFYNNSKVNLFRKCAESYGFGERKNSFSVGEQLMLYAFIYMQRKNSFDLKKFRFLRNIFSSSEDQLRNDYLRTFLYSDVELIIDSFDQVISKSSFSDNSKLSIRQCREEKEKLDFISNDTELARTIYKLEDHIILRGNIAIFNLNDSISDYALQFYKIFSSDNKTYLDFSKALLTIGDYSQEIGSLKRYGNQTNSNWRELFTQSEGRKGFANTKNILNSYLERFINDPEISNEEIIDEYLESHLTHPAPQKKFNFYKIKYDMFTLWHADQTQGYYSWGDIENKPYELWMLFRKQFNGRHWSPFLLQLQLLNECCELENYGDYLQYTNGKFLFLIENVNNGFRFKETDEFGLNFKEILIGNGKLNQDGVLIVAQDEDGFDIEDRIVICNDFLNTLIIIES